MKGEHVLIAVMAVMLLGVAVAFNWGVRHMYEQGKEVGYQNAQLECESKELSRFKTTNIFSQDVSRVHRFIDPERGPYECKNEMWCEFDD